MCDCGNIAINMGVLPLLNINRKSMKAYLFDNLPVWNNPNL